MALQKKMAGSRKSKKLNPQIVGKAYFMNKENKLGVAA